MLKDKNTNSAALAQLLNKDYSSSRSTLENIKHPDAMTYYIKAVLGARTANVSLLYDGLKQAVKLDPSMAKKASGDLEFTKYAQDATFKNIIK
jgi:beta-lactamase class A